MSASELAMHRERNSARTRFTWGLVLLVVGGLALSVNLGLRIPRDLWEYWPTLPLAIGAVQLVWPGSMRDRFTGYWLVVLGVYGFVSVFEMFGLHWGTSWPIWLVAAGIRIILGGVFRFDRPNQQGGNAP
jgi:hypothetical protein